MIEAHFREVKGLERQRDARYKELTDHKESCYDCRVWRGDKCSHGRDLENEWLALSEKTRKLERKYNHACPHNTSNYVHTADCFVKCPVCDDIPYPDQDHDWSPFLPKTVEDCQLVRECTRCHDQEAGEKMHDTTWKYKSRDTCELQAICQRCKERGYESREPVHKWSAWDWVRASGIEARRICRRCRARQVTGRDGDIVTL